MSSASKPLIQREMKIDRLYHFISLFYTESNKCVSRHHAIPPILNSFTDRVCVGELLKPENEDENQGENQGENQDENQDGKSG